MPLARYRCIRSLFTSIHDAAHREAEMPDGEKGSRAIWALKTLSTIVICPDMRTLNCHRLPNLLS